jgi:hypothetical protein
MVYDNMGSLNQTATYNFLPNQPFTLSYTYDAARINDLLSVMHRTEGFGLLD